MVDTDHPSFPQVEAVRNESVISITGTVKERTADTVNAKMATGEIEININEFELLSAADTLPLQVNSDEDSGEETRLRYRYLDLRRHAHMQIFYCARKSFNPSVIAWLAKALQNSKHPF